MQALQGSAFEIVFGMSDFKDYTEKLGNAYPVLIDQESLMWSLGMAVGDTLHYQKSNGETVHLLIAGTLASGIFQGYALMDRQQFKEIWPEIAGSEIMLIKTEQVQQVSNLLSTALNEYGIRVTTTVQRLNKFNELVNTYLSIFLTLGGIGMLLGILSFIIVIRKNLLIRQKDIRLYRNIGYAPERIEKLLFRENVILPLYAVVSGAVSALISVYNNFWHNDWTTWLLALAFMALFICMIVLFVRRTCHKAIF
jgi:putative ABC transport system permease protein